MKQLVFSLLLFAASLTALTPKEALQRLMEGNKRYMEDYLSHASVSASRREEILNKQSPFAVIVGCSDSRVPPEIIFDEGLGDLFIVRVAGNVVGPIELDSIEYAVKVLGSVLIVVLGHQSCGAVNAVVQNNTEDIEAIANLIKPAIGKTTDLEKAVKANIDSTVAHLKNTPLVKAALAKGKVGVVGAYYNLGSGKVEIIK